MESPESQVKGFQLRFCKKLVWNLIGAQHVTIQYIWLIFNWGDGYKVLFGEDKHDFSTDDGL